MFIGSFWVAWRNAKDDLGHHGKMIGGIFVAVMVVFSSVIPAIFLRKNYFNPLLHSIAYIVEALLWVVIFILMIGRVSPITGFLVMSFIFLRSGLYWWLLELRDEKKRKKKKTNSLEGRGLPSFFK